MQFDGFFCLFLCVILSPLSPFISDDDDDDDDEDTDGDGLVDDVDPDDDNDGILDDGTSF